MAIIEKTADGLMERIKTQKHVNLRHLTRDMAAIIVTAIVGLNPSQGLIRRLDAMLHAKTPTENSFRAVLQKYYNQYHRLAFLFADVMPAIRRRRKAPQNDVISYMLAKGKRPMDIFVECVVYGAAGVATTQEFICVVLLHCMEDPKFCEIMLSDDASARYEALNEILRLEPVIGKLYRKSAEPVTVRTGDQDVTIPAGERIAFHVYDVNVDPQAVPECPHERQAHRELQKGVYRSMIGFGSGPHRCAGAHLALAETDVFIQKLLRLPGLRIEKAPNIIRNDAVEGYEIHNLMLAVE
jgi:cytochrome P450